ncbi:MAG: response regulator [Verrucomicrobia bacterium]|nr:response regulator [Verrucomicrobiota bacterium]
MKVLVVEDDRATRYLLVQVLTERGHDPVACENAEQAMRAVRQEFFPLIVLDLLLPGTSGLEFCRWLRAQPQGDLPYLLVETVKNQPEDLAEVMQAGTNDYLAKPYDLALLRVRLTVAMRQVAEIAARTVRGKESLMLLEELRHQQQRLDDLLASVPGIVWEIWGRPDSATMRVGFVSNYAERLLGYGVAEWLTRPNFWYGIMHPEDKVRAAREAAAIFDTGKSGSLQFRWLSKSGQTLWMETHCVVVPDAAGAPQGLRGVALDITQRRELEKSLQDVQKLETVGQLAAGVAHGFNNLLTIIRGYASLLEPLSDQVPDLAEPLKHISVATDRAAELTRQLLAFSRRQMMMTKPLEVSELIQGLAPTLETELGGGIRLHLDSAKHLPLVNADPRMLEHVVLALAANARDAMPGGGRFTVSTAAVRLTQADARRNPEAAAGDFVCLSVADTGCGMDAATLRKVFEPFFTTKDVGQGTGLSLSSVYGTIKQHHGWIEVASQVGKGTTFKIFLPVLAPALIRPLAPTPAPFPPGGRAERILLVEDEGPVRELAKLILERAGFQVLEATSGTEAIAVWTEEGGRVDLLFTDMVMPDGMSGRELAERLRVEKPALKVVYTSGYTMETLAPDSALPKGTPFLGKPYDPQMLIHTIRKCLDE